MTTVPIQPAAGPDPRRFVLFTLLLAVVVTGLVYSYALPAPLIFDDLFSIEANARIRHLWPPTYPLVTIRDLPTAGRPVVNLSFAIDYAIFGNAPWAFRLHNMALHVVCGLLLALLLRRMLRSVTASAVRDHADGLALAVTALWLAHPLNTEAVVYITQRTELLVSLFMLLTVYAAARGWESGSRRWLTVSVVCCALGMASKENMVAAPLLVLLYQRAFVSPERGLWGALRGSWRYYAALAVTWGVLLAMLATDPRPRSTGVGHGVSAWEYLMTQSGVITHYLKLCFWPYPLAITHHWPIARSLSQVLLPGLFIFSLVLAGFYALWRHPKIGFAAMVFFFILAPTSSVVPILTEVAADRRMYLPSAAVLTLALVALWRWCANRSALRYTATAAFGIALATAAVLAGLRAAEYRDPVRLWQDTLDKFPDSLMARINYGATLMLEGRIEEGRAYYEWLGREHPNDRVVASNYGSMLLDLGELDEARQVLDRVIESHPDYAPGLVNRATIAFEQQLYEEALHFYRRAFEAAPYVAEVANSIGVCLSRLDRREEAIAALRQAIHLKPEFAQPYLNLAELLLAEDPAEAQRLLRRAMRLAPNDPEMIAAYATALAGLHRYDEAIEAYRRAIDRFGPRRPAMAPTPEPTQPTEGERKLPSTAAAAIQQQPLARAYDGLGAALSAVGRHREALAHLQTALELAPDRVITLNNYGVALAALGQLDEARQQYDKALALEPDHVASRYNLGNALAMGGRFEEAIERYRQVLALNPRHGPAQLHLADTLAQVDRLEEAIVAYRTAAALMPNHPPLFNNWGIALARQGRLDEAVRQFERAVQLQPTFEDARANLARARSMLNSP